MTRELVDRPAQALYRQALRDMRHSGIPFLVGGAFALESYAGVVRRTKDLDVFVHRETVDQLMRFLAEKGYATEVRFPHWICKAWKEDHVIDIIFGSGNGICAVDAEWFGEAPKVVLLGEPAYLVPVEEMIWSKAFVMDRERYDGADIAHLFHACSRTLDWSRLLRRFHAHWRVLFSHMILFGYVYPGRRLHIPRWLMGELLRRVELESVTVPSDRTVCQGTLLSWGQYLDSIERGEYEDARHPPRGSLTAEQTEFLTAQFRKEQHIGSDREPPRTSRRRRSPHAQSEKSAA
ncbi:MAG: hypothetical protein A4E19_19815 [Nitrospira sp. SG-bin1]|nr:MAG: hypothetical protein A4E19_19815 [Nitrospira sp. SG-bin1]